MYSTISNQLYHLLHFSFSIGVIGIIAPYFVFPKQFIHKGDQLISNYIRAVFSVIILGYVLVLIQLYEVLSLLFLYLLVFVILYFPVWKKMVKKSSISEIAYLVFDMLDGLISLNKEANKKKVVEFQKSFLEKFSYIYGNKEMLGKAAVLTFVFGYSLFIRFYDSVRHAALPLSDSYVTLAWMKYISGRILFHDGIYPQGFHIILATIQKFAAIDSIYILKYTGPLNTFCIVVLLYFFINRLTNQFMAGIVAASIYGLAGPFLLFNSLERQVATNSQEFAFVFIFPAFYFLIDYLLTKNKSALITGILATTVIGLVHSIAFAYVGMGIGLLMVAYVLIDGKKAWKPVLTVAIYSIGSSVIAVIPFIIGKVLGKQVHSSSADYLTSTSPIQIDYQPLNVMDIVSLCSLVILFFFMFHKKLSQKERLVMVFTFLLGLVMFIIFFAGGTITNSVLISSRSLDLWALTIPIIVGVTLFSVTRTTRPIIQWSLMTLLILFIVIVIRPNPIQAYKLERDSTVEQYLQISKSHTPKSWMIVSQDEGYAKVLGNGIHMYLKSFLEMYDPTKPPLTRIGSNRVDYSVPPDVFVFHEKKVFRVSEDNDIYPLLQPKYKQREKDNKNFKLWLKTYQEHGYKVERFYEDANFAVYHFNIPPIKKQKRKRFWED